MAKDLNPGLFVFLFPGHDIKLNTKYMSRDQVKTTKVPQTLSQMTICIWVKISNIYEQEKIRGQRGTLSV